MSKFTTSLNTDTENRTISKPPNFTFGKANLSDTSKLAFE